MISELGRYLLDKENTGTLTLVRRSDPSAAVEFIIRGLVGEGGSSVCYEAQMGNKRGRLKEFYPVDAAGGDGTGYFFLERTDRNQLVPVGEGMRRRFEALCDDFVGVYDTLERVKAEGERHELLNNFIPTWEIFCGLDSDGRRASVYVWTPDDKKGQNFGDYLEQVRKNPQELPEHKLYNVLSTLITLADCIRLLHLAELLHLDIKPSNFLVAYDADMNINTGNISLFDINSICSVHDRQLHTSGTPGFRAPELLRGKSENRSDIYSIGAMLYYAVACGPEQLDNVYCDEQYDHLARLVETSPLICASATNSSPAVRYLLSGILRRCLHRNPEKRYDGCEELIADLKKARTYLLPDIFNAHLGYGKRLAILDRSEDAKRDPESVLRQLLYQMPLYAALPEDQQELNVLMIGAGTYGQKFMDLCLQVGQISGHTLRIDAFSQNSELDREVYLHYRPALKDFVDVNGEGCGGEEPWAVVRFCDTEDSFAVNVKGHNENLAQNILRKSKHRYHYIFISLGEDGLNQAVARVFRAYRRDCPVVYVVQSEEPSVVKNCTPVYVNTFLSNGVDADLERMAFNAHLCWADKANLDIRAEKKEFLQKYNYHSSLCYALSVFYKLRSVGITQKDPLKAAQQFLERFPDDGSGSAEELGELICLEHRRWVLEKVTQGWRPLLDENNEPDFVTCMLLEKTSDKRRKRHICVVRSTASMPLAKQDYPWDQPAEEDELLDPLDKISVGLHRYYLDQTALLRGSQPLQSEDILALQRLCCGENEAMTLSFRRYLYCLQNILEGNRNYSKLYRQYEEDLLQTVSAEDPQHEKETSDRLNRIRGRFYCVMESNLRKDYKLIDAQLVRSIPFILTAQFCCHLAMSFDDGHSCGGRNDVVFGNVASAMVLHPGKITYLHYVDGRTDPEHLLRKTAAVQRYLKRRHIHSRISFILGIQQDAQALEEKLQAGMAALGVSVKLIGCANQEDGVKKILSALRRGKPELYDGSTSLFSSLGCDSRFRGQLMCSVPYFEFDRNTQCFRNLCGCEYLRNIRGQTFLRVEDMFELMDARDNRFHHPQFQEDYRKLWSIYTGDAYLAGPNAYRNGVNNWNQLCTQLAVYAERADVVADITLDPAQIGFEKHFVFYVPSYGYRSAKYLVEELVRKNVLQPTSRVYGYTTDTCCVDVFTRWDIGPMLEKVMSRHDMLADPKYLKCVSRTMGDIPHVVLQYDDLTVKDLVLNSPFTIQVLEKLYENHFITRLRRSGTAPTTVSFVYSAPRIKRVLTTAGEILELYTYYEVMKQGYFDDVACGYEFCWGDGVINEVDCILTKGMRSLIVECKARKQLEQDFYHKLTSISDQFGIGTRKIMIANTYAHNAFLNEMNDGQIRRGNQMQIITIHDSNDIRNIGQTLRRMMEQSFPI